jgi:hypothetical protein
MILQMQGWPNDFPLVNPRPDRQNEKRQATLSRSRFSLKEFPMSARFLLVLAGLLALVPSSAQAFEFKNVRLAHGAFGATRVDPKKFLPGDFLFITYEIDGLKVDDKYRASFVTLVEVFDAAKKIVFQKETPTVIVPQLGGSRMPGDLHVIMGNDRPPGQYKVRLSVSDVHAKEVKSFEHAFELLPKGFGIVGLMGPAIAVPGLPYMAQFNIVELGLDAKKKPNAKLEMKILDEAGKATSPASISNFPADLPETVDLTKANFIPIDYPIFPNRAGRFFIEITVTDSNAQKTATTRYPLNVIDPAAK